MQVLAEVNARQSLDVPRQVMLSLVLHKVVAPEQVIVTQTISAPHVLEHTAESHSSSELGLPCCILLHPVQNICNDAHRAHSL